MLTVLKTYGKTIITVLSVLAVLALLALINVNGKKGLTGAVAETADFEDVDYAAFADALAIEDYTALGVPEITYESPAVKAGEEYDLNSIFSAAGTDGQPCRTEVMDVKDASGNSLLFASEEDRRNNVRQQQTDAFCFSSPGIYSICVQAVDGNRRVSSKEISLPVTR